MMIDIWHELVKKNKSMKEEIILIRYKKPYVNLLNLIKSLI